MQITVNGKTQATPEGFTLLALLQSHGLNPNTIIVELNRLVLDRQTYNQVVLSEGDKVELVHLVGGG